ncbi:hypothetical protein JOF28_000442 [Leucobacter exalbidus]|uniref:Uncharacterized protein n=1 Tax=Leucobacter exalbidus TaxID=662960 RepID=A0A940PL93_9MICO|nr:hypothetical protein [Leucobacter exalbidus]MBP1325210.1 hypothetical protein [Leucobacter exalbidus]
MKLDIGPVASVGVSSACCSAQNSEVSYLLVNWGVPGIAVTRTENRKAETWGSSRQAIELQAQQRALR